MSSSASKFFGALVVALYVGAGAASAQMLDSRERPVIGDVVDAKGQEDFTPVEIGEWRDVLLGQDLSAGDLLRTGAYGGLGITFTDRTYIRLHANTQMSVTDPGSATTPRRFALDLGRMWSRASRPEQGVLVETPTATAAVRGTDWYMDVAVDGTSRLVVLNGDVEFFNDLGALSVGAGISAIARPGQAPEFELLVISEDRPRWALTPRSNWLTYLPYEPATRSASRNLFPVWQNIANRRPQAAQTALSRAGAAPADEVGLAQALIALMQRDPLGAETRLEALDLWQLNAEQRQLADAATIGAQIDLADLAGAATSLEAYEQSHGRDFTYLALAAQLDAYAGRYDSARSLADEASRTAPDDWRWHLLTAQVAVLQANDPIVDSNTSQAIALAPDSAAAWHWRGIYLASAGAVSPGEVQKALEKAATLNPERVTSLVSVAQLSAINGKPDRAIDIYKQALELDSSEPFALAGLAFVHLTMDRLDRAEAVLAPIRGTDLELHPEVQSARAIMDIMAGDPDRGSESTGRVIAANPDRTGAAQLDAIAHWQAGRHAVAIDVIENAMRLDPNDPVSARIASAMAQDQYRAGDAVDFARAAWDAKRRNVAAGLVQLPASQSGRIDIGGAFQYAGLPAQGEYYSSLARAQADANSAFGYAQIYPNSLARQSSTSTGLLLDPLSVTYPNRFATFFRAPGAQQTLDVAASIGTDDVSRLQLTSDTQALIRTPRQPVALAGFLTVAESAGPLENDTSQSALLSLRAGTVRDGRHSFLGRLTVDHRDTELPGSFGLTDLDDEEETTNTVVGFGYTFSESFTDRWMFQASGGWGSRSFENPSPFGSGLTDLDYSLAVSLGLANARLLAARNLQDTSFSTPNQPILAVDPPATLPVTGPVGLGLVPFLGDTDPVFDIDADVSLLSLQGRRIVSLGEADFSFGLEFGSIDANTDQSELGLAITGAGAIADFAANGAITTFDFGTASPLVSTLDSRSRALQAHALGTWKFPGAVVEAGLFPIWTDSRLRTSFSPVEITDETATVDPRLGIALRGDQRQLRIAVQRTRLLPGVDSIAPIGTLGLLPNESLGAVSERTDSAIVRIEQEVGEQAFVHATLEYQDLKNTSAGLAGERIEQAAFFAENAELTRLAIGADLRFGDKLAVSMGYALNEGEIDGGPFDGRELPIVAEHSASIGATWVDPRFFRAEGSLSFLSERFADSANLIELDEAVVLSAGLAVESRDKSWLFRIDGQATFSDDSASAIGQPATDSRLTVGLSRRW